MIKKLLNKPNVKQILIILFAAIFVCIPLLSNKIDITNDDGIQHIARLIGTESSIKEGQTSIMSDFCNGFGYSWNLFYSPVTAFVPLIFRVFGTSFVNCIKIFMFFVTFLSGITMYFFTEEVTKDKKIALLSSIIYIFAPYRFTDMYIRNALAELTSFVFIPMVFQGLYGILKQKSKREIIFIIGTILLILTHTIATLYTAIICLIYVLTQIKKIKIKAIIIKLISSLILIIIITAFFWIPLLEIKNMANYEVFKPGRMEREDVLISFKLNVIELFITPNNSTMIYQIGFLNIALLIFTPFVITKIKNKYHETDFYKFYLFSIIITLILLFMTLKVFPFENMPELLKIIQFTFRLLEFTSFFISFIVSVNLSKIIKNIKYKDIFLVMIIIMILSVLFVPKLKFTEKIDESRLIPAVPVTKETGRVHAGCASFEYLPSKAFENRKYIEERNQDVIILEGNAEILNLEKNGSKMSFDVINIQNSVRLELPYIYYPGYQITIDGVEINYFETENGFIRYKTFRR